MHLAIITAYPPSTGSLNEYAYHFVRHLRRKPEVSAVSLLVDDLPPGQSYADDLPTTPERAPVRFVPAWGFDRLDNALRIRNHLRQLKPDAVIFNIQFASFGRNRISGALGLFAPLLARAAGFPTIVLLHNIMETVDLRQAGFRSGRVLEWITRRAGDLMTRALLRADLVALTIPKYVELIERKYGAPNVLLAPHGAFDDTPQPISDPPTDPLRIMTFGKFGTYKRVEPLIEAFRLLPASHRPPLELLIAGSDSPNAPGYLADVQQRYADVRELRFTGYVAEADVPGLFHSSGVIVLPYTSTTGSSGVLHQAGDYARAVVLPKVGDLAELIAEEGYAGEFFEPGDHHSLAEAIGRLIDDPARRYELGMRNFMAARGIPMSDVVDWYVLHVQNLLQRSPQTSRNRSSVPADVSGRDA